MITSPVGVWVFDLVLLPRMAIVRFLTTILLTVLWIPYIIGSVQTAGPLTPEEYQEVITSRPDTILLSPAFGLENTRSPRAVESRAEYARLSAKRRAKVPLSKDEQQEMEQLTPFVDTEEEL